MPHAQCVHALASHGVKRINVSLDTLDAAEFRAVTRWGDLDKVLEGIKAAQDVGIVKINAVALKGVNEDEFVALVEWAHGAGMDLTFIEVMPLGDVGEGRFDQYLPLSMVRARIAERFTLEEIEPAGRPATSGSRKPAGGSGSSPRSPIISANPAARAPRWRAQASPGRRLSINSISAGPAPPRPGRKSK